MLQQARTETTLRDFRLLPRRSWELRPYGLLCRE